MGCSHQGLTVRCCTDNTVYDEYDEHDEYDEYGEYSEYSVILYVAHPTTVVVPSVDVKGGPGVPAEVVAILGMS